MIKVENLKNQKGFTLVEVIVVAIIVAALAAVAIPVYTSYVTNSRNNAAANAAGSAASFVGACINQAGTVTVTDGAVPTAGVAASLACTVFGAAGITMQLPAGIFMNIVPLSASPGVVTATHMAGGTIAGGNGIVPQTYNF